MEHIMEIFLQPSEVFELTCVHAKLQLLTMS